MWIKGKGLSRKGVVAKNCRVAELEQGSVLLRIDKFAFSHMALGYLMKGFTRTFAAYHSFYPSPEDGCYRSACWGYATVLESEHPKGVVGTRLFGVVPACKYTVQQVGGTIPRGRDGEPEYVEISMEGLPYNLRRFSELEVVEDVADVDPDWDEWKMVMKEIYTM